MPTPPRRSPRPTYDVWLTPADDLDAEPEYFGPVQVRHVDQLTAETQAKGLGVDLQAEPFHLTALWLWAALVRLGTITDKFHTFVRRLEYSKAAGEEEDQAQDPSSTGQGANTG